MACVYQIRNLVNGKLYVGSTVRHTYVRKYEHFGSLRKNKHRNAHLQNAFNKYGEEFFLFEIIEKYKFPIDYSKDLMIEYVIGRELYYTQLLNPEYNIRVDIEGRVGYHHSKETRIKISEALNARPPSEATIKRREIEKLKREGNFIRIKKEMSGKGTGRRPKGWNHSPEAIEKIRERSSREDNRTRIRELQKIAAKQRIGSHWSAEIKVKMMSTKFGKDRYIEIYTKKGNLLYTCNFSPEAAKITGISRSAISNNLVGLSKSAGGFIFKYKDN